jgi:hypothetical protein
LRMSKRKRNIIPDLSNSGSNASSELNLKEFTDYICTKAYDIISEGCITLHNPRPSKLNPKLNLYLARVGRYKRFLAKSRDASDAWAVSVHASMCKVNRIVRDINNMVSDIESNSSVVIGAICREVLSNTAPPAKIKEGTRSPTPCLLYTTV